MSATTSPDRRPMRFRVVTLLPDAVRAYLAAGVVGRAWKRGGIDVQVIDLRHFGVGRHKKVDDAPYGGGAGMVLMPGPLRSALDARDPPPGPRSRTVLLSASGRRFDQALAREAASRIDDLTLVCGRYEGVDARVEAWVDEEWSLGDFVLTGGEPAALAMIDAIARLLPDTLGNATSADDDSFGSALVEHPQYTRPEDFDGQRVPAELLTGDHEAVRRYRLREALRRTRDRRPERLGGGLPAELRELLRGLDSTLPEE
jgi:tRNA (guanine37-N1)-methyltransferase